MSQTETYIKRLEALKEGDWSQLRRLAGQPLDGTIQGFDLFAGLWWPLRHGSAAAPRRETSWLVAKLYGAFPIAHVGPEERNGRATLARLLGCLEPTDVRSGPRYRGRFDALICAPLPAIEPGLRWALSVVAGGIRRGQAAGMDWAQLLDDLSLWDRVFNLADTRQKGRIESHKRLVGCRETHHDPQELWACEYLWSVTRQL